MNDDATLDTICEYCFPGVRTVGNVTPTLVVGVDNAGTYSLFIEPVHAGDLLATFAVPPTEDPVGDVDDDADLPDETWMAGDTWVMEAERELGDATLAAKLGVAGCARLVRQAEDAGYDARRDGAITFWLYNRICAIVGEAAQAT